jgi:hypothetical protein
MGRFLAVCGWLAWQTGRSLRRLPLPANVTGRQAASAVGVVLLALAVVPFIIPLFDAQPRDVTVQQVLDGQVSEPGTWVRLQGSTVELDQDPTEQPGRYGILADAFNPLRAIVLEGDVDVAIANPTNVTGYLAEAIVVVDTEELPIEATVAGTPPTIVGDRLVELDTDPRPVRASLWPLSIIPLLLGGLMLLGARVGYPLFRETFEIDVLATPLGAGERLPAAFGGRVGAHEFALDDPGAALLIVRRGPKGNVLTVQQLADAGPPPQPVPIGGGWTSGRTGYVYTLSESVPALAIRAEDVDATFLFANTRERDRIAALVAVAR